MVYFYLDYSNIERLAAAPSMINDLNSAYNQIVDPEQRAFSAF